MSNVTGWISARSYERALENNTILRKDRVTVWDRFWRYATGKCGCYRIY
jgi:hypothetical protein